MDLFVELLELLLASLEIFAARRVLVVLPTRGVESVETGAQFFASSPKVLVQLNLEQVLGSFELFRHRAERQPLPRALMIGLWSTYIRRLLGQLDKRLLALVRLGRQPLHLFLLLVAQAFAILERALHLFAPHFALLLERADVRAMGRELSIQPSQLGLEAVFVFLRADDGVDERLLLVLQAPQAAFDDFGLTEPSRHLLIGLGNRLPDFGSFR